MKKEKILIVEDTAHLRLFVRKCLERAGFEVLEAIDGEHGIRCLQLDPEIRLVLLDVMMPNLNGVDFLARIAPLKTELGIKICMMTAKEQSEDIRLCLRSGADDYLVKPVDEPILVDKVKILLAHLDVNNFSSAKLEAAAWIGLLDSEIAIQIRLLSESSIIFSSEIELPLGAKVYIHSPKLTEILRDSKPLLVRLYKSERDGLGYKNSGSLVALKDSDYKLIRSVSTRGEFV